jgi:hypothetical protein
VGMRRFISPEVWNAIIAVRTERAETTGCYVFSGMWHAKVLY